MVTLLYPQLPFQVLVQLVEKNKLVQKVVYPSCDWIAVCASALCGENPDASISLAIHLLGQLILGKLILSEHLCKHLFYCRYSVYGRVPYLKPALKEQKFILMCASQRCLSL